MRKRVENHKQQKNNSSSASSMQKKSFKTRSLRTKLIISFLIPVAFIVALVLMIIVTPRLRDIAFRTNYVEQPKPGTRKIHKEPKPYLAAVGIFFVFWLVYFLAIKSIDIKIASILVGDDGGSIYYMNNQEKVSTSRTFSQGSRASPVNRRCPAFERTIRAVCCANDHGHGQQKERETYQH